MSLDSDLTADRLRVLYDYDALTGNFSKAKGRHQAGRRVVGQPCFGYIRIRVDGKYHYAHRLAWLHYYGEWPGGALDHINGRGEDNRIANLRGATLSQNQANSAKRRDNSSGVKGVRLRCGNWCASIRVNGRRQWLGTFKTKEEAGAAYAKAAAESFGEFARTE